MDFAAAVLGATNRWAKSAAALSIPFDSTCKAIDSNGLVIVFVFCCSFCVFFRSEHKLETRRKMEKFLNDLSSETAAAEKRKAEDKVSIAIVAAVTDALKLAELIPDERLYVRRPSKPNQCYGIPIANLIRCVKTNLTSVLFFGACCCF